MGALVEFEAVVADASALVPFLVHQSQTPFVVPVFASSIRILAPDLILAELANTLRTLSRKLAISQAEARGALDSGRRRIDVLTASPPLADRALELALLHDHPAYDCFYVALAERERLPLATCDRRLALAFSDTIDVRLLGPEAPPTRPPRRKR